MESSYRLKAPVLAILDKPDGEHVSVTIPVGAVLNDSSEPSTTLLGMIGVFWEGRHYSVSFRDLLKNGERIQDPRVQGSCDKCLSLEDQLRRATDYYVRLTLQQDRMARDANAEARVLYSAIKSARRARSSAAQDLLAHRRTHEHLSRPTTRATAQL